MYLKTLNDVRVECLYSEGAFFAVKEVSLLDQGSNAQQSILALEQVFFAAVLHLLQLIFIVNTTVLMLYCCLYYIVPL